MTTPTFIYPVGNVTVSQPFVPGGHTGIDFAVPVGTPVHAALDGTIESEGLNNGYGNLIIIRHAGGWETYYAHLSAFSIPQGTTVKTGDVIALSGGQPGDPGAGDSTGPHLHFETRLNGQPVDPSPMLSGTAPSPVRDQAVTSGSSTGILANIANFFTALASGHTWVRVGQILGGLALIYVAYYIVTEDVSFSSLVGVKQ